MFPSTGPGNMPVFDFQLFGTPVTGVPLFVMNYGREKSFLS
jgi:hypothetical protein